MDKAKAQQVAAYIVDFLCRRNNGQLEEALDNQTVVDRRLMLAELESILYHEGKPPNWIT